MLGTIAGGVGGIGQGGIGDIGGGTSAATSGDATSGVGSSRSSVNISTGGGASQTPAWLWPVLATVAGVAGIYLFTQKR